MEQRKNDDLSQLTARRKAIAARNKAIKKRRTALTIVCGVLLAVLIAGIVMIIALKRIVPLQAEITVEAGSSVSADQFLSTPGLQIGQSVYFKTNMSGIDMNIQGDYEIELYVDGTAYSSILHVRDTVPPKADPVEMTVNAGMEPRAEYLVTNVVDVGQVTVSFAEEPDLSKGGETIVKVLLTDQAGNTSIVQVKLMVLADVVKPVIHGATDRVFYVGDAIVYTGAYEDYLGNVYPEVTATDSESKVTLTVDRDAVDTSKAGTYPVTYNAVDAVGNLTSVTVQFTLVEKPQGTVDPKEVYALAREVLDQISTEEMSDMEVAFAIYRWVSTNIGYVSTSDKTSWIDGAYQAFTQYYGDCFNYFAAAKALYEVAGIENVDVVKSDTSHSSHYWSLINLGDGWYHVDCTPRSNPGQFFMNTDAELEAYSVANRNSHIFDGSLYPERATESVQHLVDYGNGVIKED